MLEETPEHLQGDHNREKLPEETEVFYLISDIHMLSKEKENAVWKKLELEIQKDQEIAPTIKRHTILMGDLPLSDLETRIVNEFKQAKSDKTKLSFEDEEEEKTFDQVVEKRGWRAGAYRAAKMNTPEKVEEAKRLALDKISEVAKQMKRFSNPIVYPGNAETNSPYPGIEDQFKKENIPYFPDIAFVEVGKESAMVVWPSFKDPKSFTKEELDTFEKVMEEKVQELVQKSRSKKHIFIVAHEQPFHGSRQFKERTAGEKTYGEPFRGVNPTREFLFRFIASLSPEQQVGIAYGHLHDSEEIIRKGTGLDFAKSDSGGAKWSVRSKDTDGDIKMKEFDLFYIPQNSVGVLSLSREGFDFERRDS